MNQIKLSLVIVFSFLSIGSIVAQYVWYENSSSTNHINLVSATEGTFSTDETNPETNGINSNTTVSKFVRDGEKNPRIDFDLRYPITDFSSYTISLKAHTSIPTTDLTTRNKRIRLYLRNSSIGNSSNVFKQLNFTEGETWETFSFDFDDITIPADVTSAGGYDELTIYFAFGDNEGLTSTYHIDAISGSSDQAPCQTSEPLIRNADFLSGSWGVRLNMFGGFRLDDSSDQLDWVAGAQEIVDNLPAVGHVITNATHPAQAYYYTLRDNPYVDIANEIHPAMVPSLENEQIILDVIDVFKQADKKVILYLNGGGPSALQGNSAVELEILAAWEAYYNREFDGNEGLAWRTLVKGYVERFEGLVDGYWLDNLGSLPGSLHEFVAVIKEADPNVIISTNGGTTFLTDENDEIIYVDSDGIDDDDPRDYPIRHFTVSDPYMDLTGGHPTSLGKGAPPNSWAYEEFHFPSILANPWGTFDCKKEALKHYFAPIRDKWSVSTAELMFEVEQAYRFVRTFTDAGACITWSTTQQRGLITDDEMAIMVEINDRMLQSPKPDPEPYVRPEGAFLVGEMVLDNDNDGFTNDVDCDDSNPAINPGAPEIADNGIDEDCNGSDLVTLLDNDNDGFTDDVDCDDTNAAINPNAVEVDDNEVDENCDGILGMTVVDPNVLNLGFEEGMVNWEQATPRGAEFNFDIATSDSPEGVQHAVLNVTSQGTNTPNQARSVGIRTAFNVPVTGGTYKLSYRIKSATPDKNIRARLFINDGGDGGQGTITGEVHIAPAEWTLFEQNFVIPELTSTGNPTMFVRILLGVGGTLGDISIDDIVIAPTEVSPPADNDGDGFTADVDCDDTNAAINPNAIEVDDNEVDENCDGILGMTVVDPNVLNLGFEEGKVNWEQATPRGAEFNFDIATSDSPEGGQHAVLNVTSQGTNTQNQSLAAGIRTAFNVPVTGGTYKLSYRIKSATPGKNIRARLFINDGGDGGQGTITGEVHIAPAEWTLFEQNFVLPELTNTGNPTKFVRVLLGVGGTLGDISIDDIVIAPTEVSPPADNDGDGFTADVDCDDTNAAINPNAAEVDDNEVDENCDGILGMTVVAPNVLNLGFEEGMVNWEQATPRGAEFNFDIATSGSPEGGQHAVLNVTSQGTNTPNQARSVGIRTAFNVPVTGGTYKLSYRIKSATPDKNIRARLFINDGGDGGQGTITGEVHIAPAEWTLFEQDIVIPELTSTGNLTKFARILLGVGGTLGDISIDDIVIAPTEVSPPADNDGDGFTDDVDCDDSNAAINPSASEIANSGFDENCDGVSLIIDNDNDGFNSSIDCDDNNASINSGAPEIANNGIDEDCNGSDLVTVLDNDNDGFTDDVDCDDSNAAINPSASEIANSGFDENCDGVSLIIDNDNDGFNSSIDCDDNNASINSGAAEIPNNGIDEDCNGSDLVTVLDNDNDGFTDDVDCDDSNAAINPDAEEISGNEIDENCDGELEMTTNTLEQELVKSLKLYPNPTNGMIYLEQNDYLCEACKIEVLDYFGRVVLQQVTTDADLIPIDVRSLNSGLLIVRISTDYGSVSKRIILVK